MRRLPPIDDGMFPRNAPGAISVFWTKYWAWFFLLLPWMLMRQLFISAHQLAGALGTWNRRVDLLNGDLRLIFMHNLPSLAVTTIFGERFTAIQFKDVLIDPGPVFGARRLRRYLENAGKDARLVVATHSHEEHIGNAALAARYLGSAVFGSHITLEAVRRPEKLSYARRAFIGEAETDDSIEVRELSDLLESEETRLVVIESPGHCAGHASLFEPEQGILFAGDSFLHTVFTAPNQDVSGEDWIKTLERYESWNIRTMVGAHGYVFSVDPAIPSLPFISKRADPNEMIRNKCQFLKWASAVVAEGEQRRVPYSVVEACIFPWQRWWSWHNWFTDESGRLFSGGEFSRTYFVRSLSRTPERVPPRFPAFAQLVHWMTRRGRKRDRATSNEAEQDAGATRP